MSALLTSAVVSAISAAVAPAVASGGKSLMLRLAKTVARGSKVQSLSDIAQPARVEPLVMIDAPLAEQPYMVDILKFSLTTFAGYYMQAVSLMQGVNNIKTLSVLDALNPNRVYQINLPNIRDAVFSKEVYSEGLPALEAFEEPIERNLIVSVEVSQEDVNAEAGARRSQLQPQRLKEEMTRRGVAVSSDSVKKLYEIENLAVGKIVSVELRDGDQKADIPVMIRLIPTKVDSRVLTHIFTATAKNTTFKERYHLWRAGQIAFVRDLIFSVDLVDQHRKALINDTSNVYAMLTDRRRNNLTSALLSDNPSLADASNIAVISKDTAKQIAREIGGKLDSVAIRKKLFNATYLILLVVVDEQWERVTIYHRGLDAPTELSFKEIKNAEKGKGPDITEFLKAYMAGATPTI